MINRDITIKGEVRKEEGGPFPEKARSGH